MLRKPRTHPTSASLPPVVVVLTLATRGAGVSADLRVVLKDAPPGMEQVIGEAMREPTIAAGVALATALGGQVTAEGAEWQGLRPEPPPKLASTRPGRA
jgi:hypothetical protein